MKIKAKPLKRKSRTNWFSQSTYAQYGHVYLPEGVVTIFLWSGSEPRASYQTSIDAIVYSMDEKGHYSRDQCVKTAKDFMHEVSKEARINAFKSSSAYRRIDLQDPGSAYRYSLRVIHGRYPEGESVLAQDARFAYYYANEVLKGRFLEAEATIAKSPEYAYRYALNIMKDRFPEGETAIATNPGYAYWYANEVIKGRFPEAESVISEDVFYSFRYAKEIIKGRFPAGESEISKHKVYSKLYKKWLQDEGID